MSTNNNNNNNNNNNKEEEEEEVDSGFLANQAELGKLENVPGVHVMKHLFALWFHFV